MASLYNLEYSYPEAQGPGSRDRLSWRQEPEVSCSDLRVIVSAEYGDGEAITYVRERAGVIERAILTY